MTNPSQWCFISGLVSARTERLMDHRALLGLLEADSSEELRTRLRASLLFAERPPSDKPLDEVEERFEDTVQWIAGLSPDDRIGDLVLIGRQWEAFRTFVKDKLKREPESRQGKTAAKAEPADERFEEAWRCRAEDDRMEPFMKAAEEIQAAFEQQEDVAAWVDRLADAREAAALVATADALQCETLLDWVRVYAKLRVGSTLIRAGRIGWETEPLIEQWQAAGFDDPELLELAAADAAAWGPALEKLGLPHAARILSAPDATVALARKIDDHLANLAQGAKGTPFGPEVVFAFLWALRSEAINMKLVLSAAAFGIPRERVAEQLRVGYG